MRDFFEKFLLVRKFYLYKTSTYQCYNKINTLALNNRSIVLDFGANVGNFSRYINDMYKSEIYLYEANPFCCEVLRKKFSKFSNIKIFNYGVSNIDGYRKLYLHTNAQTHFSLGEGSSFDKSTENINTNNFLLVKCVSVHNILKKFKRINLLKVDIEGDEYRIINTIIKNLNKIDKVFCEFHKRSYLQKKRYIKTIGLLKLKGLYNKKICKWI